MILLDTDVMIDLLRQYPPSVAWLDSLGEEEIVLPGYYYNETLSDYETLRFRRSGRCRQ